MVFGEDKLKVVWICHFLNQSLKEKLLISADAQEYAPWITLGINEVRKRNDIDLHVIAPFYNILKSRYFNEGNVHYHCIKVGVPLGKRPWPIWFDLDSWSNFRFFNSKLSRLIKKIRPDIINLHGAENAYYSSSVLKIRNYPVLVTIQGFISLNAFKDTTNPFLRKRLQIEKKILQEMKYFGIEARFITQYIRNFNPDFTIFFYHYPYIKLDVKYDVPKEYDLVFFANMTKAKGLEDLIEAVSIIKKRRPNISLIVMGKGEESYIDWIRQKILDLDLTSNILLKGFIPTQEAMLKEAVKARISVLPTYNDTIPGTIVESMHLKLPVITYSIGGNPDINIDDERIILVEKGDVNGLAMEIEKLLSNEQRQRELALKAFEYASVEFDNANSINKLILVYKEIIKKELYLSWNK